MLDYLAYGIIGAALSTWVIGVTYVLWMSWPIGPTIAVIGGAVVWAIIHIDNKVWG